jgi:hypothetical protein
MKAFILILACLFSLDLLAETQFSPLQREAVRFMIEDSGGRADTDDFVSYLRMSHLLTKKELKRFPELIEYKGFEYVQITLDDCVYDLAIVVINPKGKAVNTLYIDFSDRE